MTCDLFAHPSPTPVAKLTILPYSQAPELLLARAASLRQDLLFLQDQWGLRGGNLSVKTSLPPGPSTQGMLALPAFQIQHSFRSAPARKCSRPQYCSVLEACLP